jgi:hypothetical protein
VDVIAATSASIDSILILIVISMFFESERASLCPRKRARGKHDESGPRPATQSRYSGHSIETRVLSRFEPDVLRRLVLTISCDDCLKSLDVERLLSDDLLQGAILVIKRFQPLHLADFMPPSLAFQQ